jgi:hypothetical protein
MFCCLICRSFVPFFCCHCLVNAGGCKLDMSLTAKVLCVSCVYVNNVHQVVLVLLVLVLASLISLRGQDKGCCYS